MGRYASRRDADMAGAPAGPAAREGRTESTCARSSLLAAVREDGRALQYASPYQGDKELVLTAVSQQGLALQHASPSLRGDAEVVLTAVKQNGLAFGMASRLLRSDDGLLLAAVQQNGLALQHALRRQRNCWPIAVAAVVQCGLALQFVSTHLRDSLELVLFAIQQDPAALDFASERVRGLLGGVLRGEDQFYGYQGEPLERMARSMTSTESTASDVDDSLGDVTSSGDEAQDEASVWEPAENSSLPLEAWQPQ